MSDDTHAEGAAHNPDETAFEEVLEWLRHVNVQIPEPAAVAMRWTRDGVVDIPIEQAADDDLVIHPDRPDLEDLAHSIISIVRDCHETFPNRHSWRRWHLTRRVASNLYASGLFSNGGGLEMNGRDAIGGWIQHMPSWSLHQRPYVLWKQRWWWECHIRQGWRLRGRHTPAEPYSFSICARCLPCPTCGEPYECDCYALAADRDGE